MYTAYARRTRAPRLLRQAAVLISIVMVRRDAHRSDWRIRRKIILPIAVQVPSSSLVVLLATAIRQESRLVSLQRCLDSLLLQTLPVRVYVAWHALPALRDATEKVLLDFAAASVVPPKLLESATAKTQLQHFDAAQRVLATDVSVECSGRDVDIGGTWVMFSDDDDISASDRVAKYAELVQAGSIPRRVPGIVCARVAMRRARTRPASRSRVIGCAADVDAALRDGDVEIVQMNEYWCYAVRVRRRQCLRGRRCHIAALIVPGAV